MYDEAQAARLAAAVRGTLKDPCVLGVVEHFAGYFDELGFTVTVKPNTSDEQILALKEKIAPVLLASSVPFKWLLTFQRNAKQVGVLFPDGLFATSRRG